MGPALTESSGADGTHRVGGVGAAGAVPLGGLAQSELAHQGDGGARDDGEGDDLGQLVVEELVLLARGGLAGDGPPAWRQPPGPGGRGFSWRQALERTGQMASIHWIVQTFQGEPQWFPEN